MAESSLYESSQFASIALADNVYLNGNSIYAIADGSSWSQAQASAEGLGGSLVTINSAEENIYVFKNFGFEDDVAISSGYWIGLTDQAEEGNWKWSSNDISDWTTYGWDLAAGEPNGNGDHVWVKVGFDYPNISYEDYVEVHNKGWEETEKPLWIERGPGWDDTWESGEGTNYGVAEIPFIRRDDSAYVIVEGSTWAEAEGNANLIGGNLVSIDDEEEDQWLNAFLRDYEASRDLKPFDFFYTKYTLDQSKPIPLYVMEEIPDEWILKEDVNLELSNAYWIGKNIPSEDPIYINDMSGEDEANIGQYPYQTPWSNGSESTYNGETAEFNSIQAGKSWEPKAYPAVVLPDPDYFYLKVGTGGEEEGVWANTPTSPWESYNDLVRPYADNALYGIAEINLLGEDNKVDAILKKPFEVDQLVLRNSLYTVVDGPSWSEAEANAVKLGGNLIAITSEEESNLIVNNYSNNPDLINKGGIHAPHIGIFDDQNGNWKWSNEEEVSWTNWGPANPHNNGENMEENWEFNSVTIHLDDPHWDSSFFGKWENGTPHDGPGIAEIPFIRRGGSAYVVVDGPSWEEAQIQAESLGGNLVTVNDSSEDKWLFDNRMLGWIGFTDKVNEGDWKWISGEEGTYTNWDGSDNPSNNWESEHYAYLDGSIGTWNDIPNKYWEYGEPFGSEGNMGGIAEIHLFDFELNYQLNSAAKSGLSQNAVLGDSIDEAASYTLEITGESLRDGYQVESADITLSFDTLLFNDIQASDIRIGGAMPVANAVAIDNETGTIRIAASSLSDLAAGTGIDADTALASINLDFDETALATIEKNSDGSLKTNPLSFSLSANADETVFSKEFFDPTGLLNREIVTLNDLGGYVAVDGQDVTLYEAKVNLAQQGDGLVLGTQRIIGSDASLTNLVRSGDTLTTSAEWLNVGNIQASNLSYEGLHNQNASLVSADFSNSSIASGSFIDGVFVKDARESTVLTTDIKITGEAGNVVDLGDGIVSVKADAAGSDTFSNAGKGSSNLITFKGDLNYDGRVSMKDLAYLNAGAARQELVDGIDGNGNSQVASAASYARDVDADFSGKIDLFDLSVLDADWGKSLHTGDEQFQGSADVSWSELDGQGDNSTWDNDSFKDQNAIEAEDSYVGSLESPTSTGVIGADGNTTANDNDITGGEFQDSIAG